MRGRFDPRGQVACSRQRIRGLDRAGDGDAPGSEDYIRCVQEQGRDRRVSVAGHQHDNAVACLHPLRQELEGWKVEAVAVSTDATWTPAVAAGRRRGEQQAGIDWIACRVEGEPERITVNVSRLEQRRGYD
jgi:hypothetical protein